MPKDKVNDNVTKGWYAEVSWCPAEGERSGHVQVASVATDSPFEFPEKIGPTSFEAGERFDGWRITLDEEGLARYIKALHKAKRQAFPSQPALYESLTPVVPHEPQHLAPRFCHLTEVVVGGKGGPKTKPWWRIRCLHCAIADRFEDRDAARLAVDTHLIATHASGAKVCGALYCTADSMIKRRLRRGEPLPRVPAL